MGKEPGTVPTPTSTASLCSSGKGHPKAPIPHNPQMKSEPLHFHGSLWVRLSM